MHLMVYGEMIQAPQVEHASLLCFSCLNTFSQSNYVNSGSEANEAAIKTCKKRYREI